MNKKDKLRKEKHSLDRNISLCNNYLQKINDTFVKYENKLRKKEISLVEYRDIIKTGINGKSFRHHIRIYEDLLDKYNERKKEVNRELESSNVKAIVFIVMAFVFSSLFLVYESNFTGMVVFSEFDKDEHDIQGIYRNNITLPLEIDGGVLNRVGLSGDFNGEGLRVYLEYNDESKLLFAADNSTKIENECVSTCMVALTSSNYQIRVEMDKGEINISKIDYLVSNLKKFELNEKERVYFLEDKRFIKDSFEITSNDSINAIVYSEGELAKYITLYNSTVVLDGVLKIRYDIDLPLNIKAGDYNGKIIVMYLPDGKFTGEYPREEYSITVNTLERLSKENFSWVWFILIILVLNIGFFAVRLKFK